MGLKSLRSGGLLAILVTVASPALAQEYGPPPPTGYDEAAAIDAPDAAPPTEVPADSFYASLSPYGEWIAIPGYGRVWRPYAQTVGTDFRPYASGGHWVYTRYGWSFESDYPWGWAAFHYGRWMIRPGFGWVWAPGRVWAPAWVDWRYGDGVVGWVPLAPAGVNIYVDSYRPYWCFVQTARFVSPRIHAELFPTWRMGHAFTATSPWRHSVVYGHARYYAGPPAVHIARAVGRPIYPVAVRQPPVQLYRPAPAVRAAPAPVYGPGRVQGAAPFAAPAPSRHPVAPAAPVAPVYRAPVHAPGRGGFGQHSYVMPQSAPQPRFQARPFPVAAAPARPAFSPLAGHAQRGHR
jgi:hypothetical protein